MFMLPKKSGSDLRSIFFFQRCGHMDVFFGRSRESVPRLVAVFSPLLLDTTFL